MRFRGREEERGGGRDRGEIPLLSSEKI